MRLTWLIAALVLVTVLAAVHLYALPNYWYWYFPWLDVPVHFLGGMVMATAVIGVLGRYKPRTFLILTVGGAIGWELFQYFIYVQREANFIFDTSLDLLMDALGITLVYLIARITLWRSP